MIKVFSSIIFILIFYCQSVSGQIPAAEVKDSSKNIAVDNSLHSGKWALQFAIGSNFTLYNFDGLSISLKRHFSSKFGLRLGLSGSYYNDETDLDSVSYTSNTSNKKSVIINLIAFYYLNPNKPFNIYLYSGGLYSYSYEFIKTYDQYYDYERWNTGLLIGAGAEYFIFKEFSIFAEYSYKFTFGELTSRNDYYFDPYPESVEKRNITDFSSDPAKFGISVYF